MAVLWPLGEEECLAVVTPPDWEKLLEQIKALPLSEDEKAATERVLGGTVAWLELDAAGRLALPEQLLRRVAIKDEAQLVGRLRLFELWQPERYRELLPGNRKTAAMVGRKLKL